MADAETQIGLQPGDRLNGRYELVRIIGAGGMGQVWLANDTNLDQEVALKVLPPELGRDARAVARLKEEAKANQRLTHEHILRLHNFEIDEARGNAAFLVMEYVDGETGDELLAKYPKGLPTDVVVAMIRQIARAVDHAHGRGMLHRDIKPQNIMRCRRDRKMKLLDFGIANEARESMTRVTGNDFGDNSGTRPYMSPQQLEGRNGKGNDIYSLAATAYDLLSGDPPFSGSGDLFRQIREVMPRPLPNVPEHVNAALMAGLAKRTKDRPGTAGEFARRLGGESGGTSVSEKPRSSAATTEKSRPTQAEPREAGYWYRDESAVWGPFDHSEWSEMLQEGRRVAAGGHFKLVTAGRPEPDWKRIEPDSIWWWDDVKGLVFGPFTDEEFEQAIAAGKIRSGWSCEGRQLQATATRDHWAEFRIEQPSSSGQASVSSRSSTGQSTSRSEILDVEHWWYRTPELKLFGPYNDQQLSELVVAGRILPLGFMRRCRHCDPDEGNAWVRIDAHDMWYWPENGLVRGIWTPDQWDRLVADGQIGPGWYRRSDMFLEDGKAGWYSVEVAEGGDAGKVAEHGPAIPLARQDQFRWMAIVFMGVAFLWMIWPSESWLSWGWRLFWASGLMAIGCWSTFFFTDDFEVDTPAESVLKWVGILAAALAGFVILLMLIWDASHA